MTDLVSLCKQRKYANNPIAEYYIKIETGEIPACQKLLKQYRKLAYDLTHPGRKTVLEDSEGNEIIYSWVYDEDLAEHAIYFKEHYCHHSKGSKWAGKPLQLELWQRAMYAALYGFVDEYTGLRKHQILFLLVGRKNGKSTLAASDGLYGLIGDGEPGAEVYAVATKRDQAKIIWQEAKRMVKKSPALRKRLKTLVSEIVGIEYVNPSGDVEDYTDVFFKPLGRDSDSLDGLNTHVALFDELHAWTDFNLWDVIVDSMSSREQPLLIITTTAGFVRESVFDEKYEYFSKVIEGIYEDERVLPIIYELDHRDEIWDPKMWRKANPGLGTIKNEMQLMEKVNRARNQPSQLANLLCKDFNLPQTSGEAWLTYDDLNNEETFDPEEIRGSYFVGGVDLSATTDLTCATILVVKPETNKRYVMQMYWLPENELEKKVNEEKIPYDKWVDRGLVRLSGSSAIDHRDVTAWFIEMMQKYDLYPFKIGYDRALASAWKQSMEEAGFPEYSASNPGGVLDKVAQGALTFSQPMKYLEADLKDKRLNYNNNPVLKWCLSNTTIKADTNENIRPIKGKNPKYRIDGTVSLINAYVVLYRHYNDYINLIGGE